MSPRIPSWTGLEAADRSAPLDELAGVEPVLQRDVAAGSLSAKVGQPVAVERVRLICRSLQTPPDEADDAIPKEDPTGSATIEPPSVQVATISSLPAVPASDTEQDPSSCKPCADQPSEKGDQTAGSVGDPGCEVAEGRVEALHRKPCQVGGALLQRQRFMERMQRRLAGISLPAPLASPGQVRPACSGFKT